jgi:DNA-binding transcriptional LysR family regulator
VPLLDRVGHRSELTAAGNIVYRRAVTLLTAGDDLIAELDGLRGLERGTLHLGCPLVVLLPRGHAFAGRKAVKLASLAGLPFILFEEGFALNELILDACRGEGITPKIAAHSSQIDFNFELVAAGVGIAFLPRVRGLRMRARSTPRCGSRALIFQRDGA